MVVHGHGIPLEVVKTVVEIAELAWSALEHHRENRKAGGEDDDHEISRLRSENLLLRGILEENLQILKKVSEDCSFSKDDCPPDLYARLEALVDSSSFLTKLESLHQDSNAIPNISYPPIEAEDLKLVDLSVRGDHEEPGRWVWVTKDALPNKLEEASEIDNENYVVIDEENVVDGIAEFIAKCIHENPKSKVLKPEELRRVVTTVLGGFRNKSKLKFVWEAGKVIYVLSTWGICLAGLYQSRHVVRAAAAGVHTASKFVVKAL